MDPAGPRLVDRPCLGVLVSSTGESIDLLGPVLVGRAPNGGTNDPQAALLRVPSPNQDISRTHVRIAPNEWSIEVTDMNSTNGTLVQHPGEQAIRLAPGETVTVEVGAIIDLGDDITLDIAAPR
nr:FHA domain-containing protein [Acidipropionibacterium virtanenii]